MKITQLDFSAIRSANAAQAQANQAAIAVESAEHQNQMTALDRQLLQDSISLNRQIQIGNMVTDAVNWGLDVVETVYKAKVDADTENAGNDITDITSGLQERIDKDVWENRNEYFGEDGYPSRPSYWDDWEQESIDFIKSKGYTKEVEDEAIRIVQNTYSSAWDKERGQLYNVEIAERQSAFETSKDNALKIDIQNGSLSETLKVIDGATWLTPTGRENEIASVTERFRTGDNAERVAKVARVEGQGAALDLIETLDIRSESERGTLTDLARQTDTRTTNAIVAQVSASVQEELDTGKSPRVVMDDMEAGIESLSTERKEKVYEATDKIFYSNGLKSLGLDADTEISSMTSKELNDLKESFDASRDMLFPGERLGKDADALEALITGQYDKIASANAADNKARIDQVMAAVSAGTMAPADAITEIGYLWTEDSDPSDETYANESIAKLYDMYMPPQWKNYNKQRLSSFEDLYVASIDRDEDDPEQLMQIKNAAARAQRYAIGVFSRMPGDAIDQSVIDSVWDQAMDIFTGEAITFLEDWDESGRSMVQQGVQVLDTSIQEDWKPLAMAAPAGAVQGNDENLEFADPLYEKAYDDSTIIVKAAVVAHGDIAEDALEECVIVPLEVDGIKKPIAVLRTRDGEEYSTFGGALMKKAEGEDKWEIRSALTEIEGLNSPYFTDKEYAAPWVQDPVELPALQATVDTNNPPDLSTVKDPWVMPTPEEVEEMQKQVRR